MKRLAAGLLLGFSFLSFGAEPCDSNILTRCPTGWVNGCYVTNQLRPYNTLTTYQVCVKEWVAELAFEAPLCREEGLPPICEAGERNACNEPAVATRSFCIQE